MDKTEGNGKGNGDILLFLELAWPATGTQASLQPEAPRDLRDPRVPAEGRPRGDAVPDARHVGLGHGRVNPTVVNQTGSEL